MAALCDAVMPVLVTGIHAVPNRRPRDDPTAGRAPPRGSAE